MNPTEERQLKGLLKEAIVEVLEERRDLLRDAMQESLEDVALERALKEGERTRPTTANRSFSTFDSDVSRKRGAPTAIVNHAVTDKDVESSGHRGLRDGWGSNQEQARQDLESEEYSHGISVVDGRAQSSQTRG